MLTHFGHRYGIPRPWVEGGARCAQGVVVEVFRRSTQEEELEGSTRKRWLGCLEVEGKVTAL